jgi:hypothetical protein
VKTATATPIVWFAVMGGALAWSTQFVANLFLTFAQCNQITSHRSLPLHTIEVIVSVVAVIIGVASEATAVHLFRRTSHIDGTPQAEIRGLGSPPPIGRVNFLAMMGMLVNFLVLAIIIMTAVGAPLSFVCQQS